MFTKIKMTALAASVSLIALGGAAFAMDATYKVSVIDVEASMSAAEGSNAMALYPDITTDIQAAVASRVITSDDAGDPEIRIDIHKVALNGAAILPDTKEFNELEGVVSITGPEGADGGYTFPINIAAYTGDQIVPEGYSAVLPSETDFYEAMVNSFADSVAEGLEKLNPSGTDTKS